MTKNKRSKNVEAKDDEILQDVNLWLLLLLCCCRPGGGRHPLKLKVGRGGPYLLLYDPQPRPITLPLVDLGTIIK